MRAANILLSLVATAAIASAAFGQPPSAPLDPIAGFELRLLDKKFPVRFLTDGKTEEHEMPIWVYMPEAGATQAVLDDITQPVDLDSGTTLLPPPPAGFGLRR